MILLAAATFFKSGIQVEELQQAKSLLEPLLGSNAAIVFALALLMAGISSTITSGMAAGSIFAGIFGESLAGRGDPLVGNCAVADFLYWRSIQGITDFADDIEYPVAFHGIPASRADFIPKGNGELCQ